MGVNEHHNLKKGVQMDYFKNINGGECVIVSGRSNPPLVKLVAEKLGIEPVFFDTENWTNGTPRCVRPDGITLSNKRVFIITSLRFKGIGSPVEELKALKMACMDANEVILILTWFCSKDDIPHGHGNIPSAYTIAWDIASVGFNRIYWFDPHQSTHLGYFYYSYVRRFYLLRLLIDEAKRMGIGQIVAPDLSASKRAKKVEEIMKTGKPFFTAVKDHDHQAKDSPISFHGLTGQIMHKKLGIFDDMILTFGTAKGTIEKLNEMSGSDEASFRAFIPHIDPTEKTHANIKECFDRGWLEQIVTTNSNIIDSEFLEFGEDRFKVIDCSGFITDVIMSVMKGHSTSKYFTDI